MLPTVVAPSKEPGVLDLPHHPIISQDPRQWVPSGCWPKTTGQTTGGGATIINVELSIGKYNSSHVYSHNNYIDWAAAAGRTVSRRKRRSAIVASPTSFPPGPAPTSEFYVSAILDIIVVCLACVHFPHFP